MARIQFSDESNVSKPAKRDASNASKPVKRMRWATTRKTDQSAVRKRLSILNRMPRMTVSSYEEKQLGHDGTNGSGSMGDQAEDVTRSQSRTIYVNQPLPDEALTEDGHIKAQYARNKIRTSKYTPLSFVPKNLYFQFHNIANIYFFFIIILNVSLARGIGNE